VSGTFCAKHPQGEFLAKGTGHFFNAQPTTALQAKRPRVLSKIRIVNRDSES